MKSLRSNVSKRVTLKNRKNQKTNQTKNQTFNAIVNKAFPPFIHDVTNQYIFLSKTLQKKQPYGTVVITRFFLYSTSLLIFFTSTIFIAQQSPLYFTLISISSFKYMYHTYVFRTPQIKKSLYFNIYIFFIWSPRIS